MLERKSFLVKPKAKQKWSNGGQRHPISERTATFPGVHKRKYFQGHLHWYLVFFPFPIFCTLSSSVSRFSRTTARVVPTPSSVSSSRRLTRPACRIACNAF